MINERRAQRIRELAGQRMGFVRAAMEALHHRHNASAILRTCDAMGLQDVHLVEDRFRVSSSSKGVTRWVTLHAHESVEEAIDAIQAAGFALWIADLPEEGTPAVPPEQVPVDRPICLWFGAELVGVHPVARERADGVVTIPMRGFAQSLNVSVAAALTLYAVAERARRRHGEAALIPPERREALAEAWLLREEPWLANEDG